MKRTIVRHSTIAALALTLSVALAACGSDDSGSGSGSSDTMTSSAPSASPSESMTESMDKPFGSACASVPTSGAGSFDGMAKDPVATAASNNPALKTLVAAVGKAGLGDTLNSAKDITVFAPTDDAFAALPKATLDAAMADPKGLLTTVLTNHVVEGRLSPDQLAGEHKTLSGKSINVMGSGEDFTVTPGDAKVVCGNVQTANATVYIIDKVLVPAS